MGKLSFLIQIQSDLIFSKEEIYLLSLLLVRGGKRRETFSISKDFSSPTFGGCGDY
jgi:hypothetical protein